MTQSDPNRRQVLRRTGAALTAIGGYGLASTSASAQTGEETDRSLGEQAILYWAGVSGQVDSMAERYLGDRSDAETAALAARDEFNPNSEEWVAFVNEHASLSGSVQIIALEFVPEPDDDPEDTFTLYLESTHDGENYTSAELVETTDREADETVRLESIAAENAASEIETAYEDYVTEDTFPDDEHLAYLAGKYRFGTAHITSTILGDELEEESA